MRKPKGPGGADADKKVQNALKKLNVQPLTGIEEVNMFQDNGNVLHFQQPKSECGGVSGLCRRMQRRCLYYGALSRSTRQCSCALLLTLWLSRNTSG